MKERLGEKKKEKENKKGKKKECTSNYSTLMVVFCLFCFVSFFPYFLNKGSSTFILYWALWIMWPALWPHLLASIVRAQMRIPHAWSKTSPPLTSCFLWLNQGKSKMLQMGKRQRVNYYLAGLHIANVSVLWNSQFPHLEWPPLIVPSLTLTVPLYDLPFGHQ